MQKAVLFAILVASTTAALAAFSQEAESQIVISNSCNSIRRELVVSYDTTGGTLTGPININLQVYNNGEVKYSRSSGLTPDTTIAHVNVGTAAVKNFANQLRSAGAFTLCDQNIAVADVPLSTLTLTTGSPTGKYHTFSYFIGFGAGYSEVSQAVNNFITTHIPSS